RPGSLTPRPSFAAQLLAARSHLFRHGLQAHLPTTSAEAQIRLDNRRVESRRCPHRIKKNAVFTALKEVRAMVSGDSFRVSRASRVRTRPVTSLILSVALAFGLGQASQAAAQAPATAPAAASSATLFENVRIF